MSVSLRKIEIIIQTCVVLFAPYLTIRDAFSDFGSVNIESSGFLKKSTERSTSINSIQFGPHLEDLNSPLKYKLDLFGIVQTSDHSSLTFEAPEAYLSKELGYGHELSLGRKIENWSIEDTYWNSGFINSRFTWDPTRPKRVGLFGLFYGYKNENLELHAMASSLNVPERGFPVKVEDGKLVTSDPFAQQNYEGAVLSNSIVPIKYTINTPPLKELILKQSFLLNARVSEHSDSGFFSGVMLGYLPINQVNLSVYLPQYVLQKNIVDVQVYPKILSHQIYSVDAGYKGSSFTFWGNAAYEVPDQWETESTDITTPRIENATITSVGFDYFFKLNAKFKSSFLLVKEDPKEKIVKQDVTIDLPSRFQFHKAIKSGIELYGSQNFRYELGWIRDLEEDSDIMSGDIYFQLLQKSSALTMNLGGDLFASTSGNGSIGKYKGNDRIRGGLAYAF